MTATEGLERNVRLYPWYVALFNGFFWMPVFFLYFGQSLSLAEVLRLEGIYYAAVVALEVPSGYFSDRVGRRATLIMSAVSLSLAYVLFVLGEGVFAVLAVAQVLLAAGIAFNSGTDTSFHLDSLAALGREGEYEEREAIAARNGLLSMSLAALLGGGIAMGGLGLAYAASAVVALLSVFVVLRFAEPPRAEVPPGILRQVRGALGQVRQPALAWLFGFAVLAVVANHVPYEFYQPYIALVSADLGLDAGTPIGAGVHMAVASLIGAWIAGHSAAIDRRLGTRRTLLAAGLLQIVVMGAMAAVLSPLILLIVALRDAPVGLIQAPLNAAVAPRIPQHQRATYLSLQSLAGRLAFASLLWGLSLAAGGAGTGDWDALSRLLFAATMTCSAALAVLIVVRPDLRREADVSSR